MNEGVCTGRMVGDGFSEQGALRPDLSGRRLKR